MLQRPTTEYYLRRTAHGSTLNAVVHARVLTRRASSRFFCAALTADLTDSWGGTTAEASR